MAIYVQLSRRLRVQRGPGNADLVSARPVELDAEGEVVRYLDDPERDPTLVEFDALCRVNVPQLLRIGAIRPYEAWAGAGVPGQSDTGAGAPGTVDRAARASEYDEPAGDGAGESPEAA